MGDFKARMMMGDVTERGQRGSARVSWKAFFSLLRDVIYILLRAAFGSTSGETAVQLSQLLPFLAAITSSQANNNASFASFAFPPLPSQHAPADDDLSPP